MNLREINEAFLGAYSPESLARLVKFELDEDLQAITDAPDFTAAVFHLTHWSEQNGRLRALVEAAKRDRPAHEAIQRLDVPLLKNVPIVQSMPDLLGRNVVNLEVLSFHIERLEKEVQKNLGDLEAEIKQLSEILTGPNGTNGIRSVALENERHIQEIAASVKVIRTVVLVSGALTLVTLGLVLAIVL